MDDAVLILGLIFIGLSIVLAVTYVTLRARRVLLMSATGLSFIVGMLLLVIYLITIDTRVP